MTEAVLQSVQTKTAEALGVDANAVSVSVTAGSVTLSVRVTSSTSSESAMVGTGLARIFDSPTSASQVLDGAVDVLEVKPVQAFTEVQGRPPYPPQAPEVGVSSTFAIVAVACAVLVLVLLALVLSILKLRRVRRARIADAEWWTTPWATEAHARKGKTLVPVATYPEQMPAAMSTYDATPPRTAHRHPPLDMLDVRRDGQWSRMAPVHSPTIRERESSAARPLYSGAALPVTAGSH